MRTEDLPGACNGLDAALHNRSARYAAGKGLGELTPQGAVTHEAVQAEVQKAVDEANSSVSRAESIRAFAILEDDFTVENGLLTPSMKLKRGVVMKEHAAEVDALYS